MKRFITLSCAVYNILLAAYPPDVRRAFGSATADAFAQQLADAWTEEGLTGGCSTPLRLRKETQYEERRIRVPVAAILIIGIAAQTNQDINLTGTWQIEWHDQALECARHIGGRPSHILFQPAQAPRGHCALSSHSRIVQQDARVDGESGAVWNFVARWLTLFTGGACPSGTNPAEGVLPPNTSRTKETSDKTNACRGAASGTLSASHKPRKNEGILAKMADLTPLETSGN